MIDFGALREKNILLAKRLIRESVNEDQFIINAVNNVEELQRVINNLSKRLREWYSLYLPELEKQVPDNSEFVEAVIKTNKQHFIEEQKVVECMGADLSQKDLDEIMELAKAIRELLAEEARLESYLDDTMKAYCPNLHAVAGSLIGGKLLRGAGSLKKLAMMRSSTIQLIGAEKALFRHIRTGAKPPKYGFLMQHVLVSKARREHKGKMARAIADKVFVAGRIDFFKGEFIGEKLLKEVEVKLK